MAETNVRSVFAWALLAVLVSACVMFFVSFQLGFFLLIFATVGWWVWKNPEEGFLLFMILAPGLSLFKATQTIGTVTLIKDVIILVLFVRVFLWPIFTKQLPYRRSILFGPALALVLWTAFETVWADSLTLGILRAREIILYLLLYLGVLYLPANTRVWQRRLGWFTASFLITAVHAAYQWFFAGDSAVLRFDPGRQIWISRISSTFAHPSVYGEYLVAASALFLSGTLFLKQKAKMLFGILFLITWPLIFLTYSRAVWLGFAAAIGVMGIIRFRGKRIWLAGLTGLAGGLVLLTFLTPAGSLLRSAFDPTYRSNQERLEFLARLIAPMSNSEAIFGRGLGNVIQQNFRSVDIGSEEITTGDSRQVQLAKDRTLVDNQYLKSFVELGLLGLVLYAWLFWRFFKACLELLRSTNDEARMTKKIIGLSGIGFLAAFVIQALFIDIWDIFPTNAMFWIIGGLIGAALTTEVKTHA